MTYYPISAYGANINAGKNDEDAQQRGWGRGWPNCQSANMVTISSAGETLKVHKALKELFVVLMNNTERRFGYNIHTAYGYSCRNISGQNVASNHSWGLAVDINPLQNPQRTILRSEIPPAAVRMWEACGFYWGGRYVVTKDAMHFEYIFRPSDVAADLVQAKKYSLYTPPPFPTGLAPNKSVPSAVGLQRALKRTGFLATSVPESANYGPMTQQAVAKFHNRYTQFRAPGTMYDPEIGPGGWKHLNILAYS